MAGKKTISKSKTVSKTKSSSKSEQPEKGIFGYSKNWEMREMTGYNSDDPSRWELTAKGSLSKCMKAVMMILTYEVEMGIGREEIPPELALEMDEMNIENFFAKMAKERSTRVEKVYTSCLQNGEYKSSRWQIRSLKSREECEQLKASGRSYAG